MFITDSQKLLLTELRDYFGAHVKAAKILGVNPSSYYAMFTGRMRIPERLEEKMRSIISREELRIQMEIEGEDWDMPFKQRFVKELGRYFKTNKSFADSAMFRREVMEQIAKGHIEVEPWMEIALSALLSNEKDLMSTNDKRHGSLLNSYEILDRVPACYPEWQKTTRLEIQRAYSCWCKNTMNDRCWFDGNVYDVDIFARLNTPDHVLTKEEISDAIRRLREL